MQDLEVGLYSILAQLLHVSESVEVTMSGIVVHGVESWRHLANLLHADRLVEYASPACIKGISNHLVVGADSRRSQEERILTLDTTECDAESGVVAVVDIVLMDVPDHLLDADRPVVVYTSLFSALQISVAAVFHPAQGRLVVVETDSTDGTCGVACLTGLGTWCIEA